MVRGECLSVVVRNVFVVFFKHCMCRLMIAVLVIEIKGINKKQKILAKLVGIDINCYHWCRELSLCCFKAKN